jgi:hypothetical protein
MASKGLQIGVFSVLLGACAATLVFVAGQFRGDDGLDRDPDRGLPGRPATVHEDGSGPLEEPSGLRDPSPAEEPEDGEETLEATKPELELPPPAGDGPMEEDPEEAAEEKPGEPARVMLELLAPVEQKDRTIAVKAVDAEQTPVEGALVVIRSAASVVYRERTNAAGLMEYTPFVDERAPFRVDAVAHGYAPGVLKNVADGAGVTVVLNSRPMVSGVVKAPTFEGGVIRVFQDGQEREERIQANGTFAVYDLDVGETIVQAEVLPYGSDSERVYLSGGESRYFKFRIKAGKSVTISGSIRPWNGKGALWINGISVPVSRRGAWTFKKAVWGINKYFVDAPGRALLASRFELKEGLKPDLNFKLLPDAKIKGWVRDARTRRPIANAQIRVGVDFGNPRNDNAPDFPIHRIPVVHTDREGHFEVSRLDVRLMYLVYAVSPGYGARPETIVPTPGTGTNIYLNPEPFLYGKIRTLTPIPRDAVVTVRPLEEPNPKERFNVPDHRVVQSGRDRKGYYHLSGLLADTYVVTIDSADYATQETVLHVSGSERLDFRLRRRGEETLDIELLTRLPPVFHDEGDMPAAEVTRLVVDARRPEDQPPFRVVRVEFYFENEEISSPLEFNEAKFDLVGLHEGKWRAILTHPMLKKPIVSDSVELREGEKTDVVLR